MTLEIKRLKKGNTLKSVPRQKTKTRRVKIAKDRSFWMINVISTRLLDAMVEQAIGFVRQAVCDFYTVFVCIRIILIQEEVNRFHLLGRKQQQNL